MRRLHHPAAGDRQGHEAHREQGQRTRLRHGVEGDVVDEGHGGCESLRAKCRAHCRSLYTDLARRERLLERLYYCAFQISGEVGPPPRVKVSNQDTEPIRLLVYERVDGDTILGRCLWPNDVLSDNAVLMFLALFGASLNLSKLRMWDHSEPRDGFLNRSHCLLYLLRGQL